MSTHSQQLAEFASDLTIGSLPAEVRSKLESTLLHNLGMLRAGARLSPKAIGYAQSYAGPGAVSLLHDGSKTLREHAIVANAAMIHARTQDDTHLPAITHLAATCLPPLMAIAEDRDVSGEELLVAMAASYEVGAAVAVEVGPAASARGLRPSSVLGGLAACVGTGRLLGLDAAGIQNAIGLAASMGGGTGQTWVSGTDEWQFQVGVAGRNGLLAAELAARGVRGSPDSLEGVSGLYKGLAGDGAFHVGGFGLGKTWRTLEVTYKPFPVCAINQMPVTVLLEMMDQLGFRACDIEAMTLRLSPAEAAYPGTDKYGPFAGPGGALMSAQFCLAAAAIQRCMTRAMVEAYDDPEVLALAKRISVFADPVLTPGRCVITVDGAAGNWRSDQIPAPPTFDWDFDEVHRRLVAMGEELAMSGPTLAGLVDCIRNLGSRSARDLVAAVTLP
ncbi:MmgE/PrpD family protein [Nocardia salmonicida]|uniref:MmgE/PrpD family protein n=1 Tax=Nocardia salmonicida TaxID=53431 RepID=UPI00366E977B